MNLSDLPGTLTVWYDFPGYPYLDLSTLLTLTLLSSCLKRGNVLPDPNGWALVLAFLMYPGLCSPLREGDIFYWASFGGPLPRLAFSMHEILEVLQNCWNYGLKAGFEERRVLLFLLWNAKGSSQPMEQHRVIIPCSDFPLQAECLSAHPICSLCLHVGSDCFPCLDLETPHLHTSTSCTVLLLLTSDVFL